MSKLTNEQLIEAVDALRTHGSQQAAAKALGIPRTTFMGRLKSAVTAGLITDAESQGDKPSKPKVSKTFTDDSGLVEVVSTVNTVDDALNKANVDRDIWEVERFLVNSWQAPHGDEAPTDLWQVKVWLRRKKNANLVKSIDTLLKRLDGKALPKATLPKAKKKDPHLLELALFDAHFGKLAWAPETRETYDLNLARTAWLNGVADLVQKTKGFEYDKIVLPIGNDFFHVNNKMMTTLSGTPQDCDGRLQKIFEVGEEAIINTVDYLRMIAPVDIVYVAGNHDETTSYFLSRVINAYFSNDKDVNVDSSPLMHKYYQYGATLLGFDHGDKIKPASLPMVMAQEVPELWAATEHHEWHTGHLHTKEDTVYQPSRTHNGVLHRRLPSISGTDAWHFGKGFNSNTRACEAYIFNKETGPTGYMISSVQT